MAVLDLLLFYFLTPAVVLLHLVISPYTKVEESFSLQATHDVLCYGIPTSNVSAILADSYDHITFPGAVPRSFVGPLVLAEASKPFLKLLESCDEQMIVRGTLGLITSLALIYYIRRVRGAYGPTTARLYTLLQLSQFHIPYYASRTLPNTFALVLTILAHACFLPSPKTHTATGIILLTMTAVIFRSEVALLLAFQSIYLLFSRRMSFFYLILAGIAGAALGLATTVSVDSYFWLSTFPSPHFTTPFLSRFSLLWPEFSAFYFNALQGQASAWGESSWHYYFSSALPKQLLNPQWLLTLPVALFTAPRTANSLIFPSLAFAAVYSLLPHKEARFIVYTIPQLTLASSLGATWLWNRRSKRAVYLLLSLGVLASIPLAFLASAGMLAVSALNYPGGAALAQLPAILPAHPVTVHLDVKTCMTGASRFLQDELPTVVWDKTENAETLLTPEFWEKMEYAVMERPERAIGAYEIVGRVEGLRRVRIYRPGEEVRIRALTEGEKVAREEGLVGDIEEEEKGWVERARIDGFGLRKVLRGWWVGVEMEESLRILKRQEVKLKEAVVDGAAEGLVEGVAGAVMG